MPHRGNRGTSVTLPQPRPSTSEVNHSYVIDHFRPARLINIGTCGGVEGRIGRCDIVVLGA